jgi:antitoxin component YwqK of YwqJK toxin-antitoxin module
MAQRTNVIFAYGGESWRTVEDDTEYNYFCSSDGVLVKNVIVNSLTHGKGVEYYPNGKVHREGFHVNGKMEGSWKTFDTEGNLSVELFYKESVPEYVVSGNKLVSH